MLLHHFPTFCSYIGRYRRLLTNPGTWKCFWTYRLTLAAFLHLLFYVSFSILVQSDSWKKISSLCSLFFKVCCEHLVICLGLKFHFSGNKAELWISPVHLDNSKYSAIPATSKKVFNSQEKIFCPQEGIKKVCIHQNKPLKFPLSKGSKGHAGWVQRQQGGRDALLHTPEH